MSDCTRILEASSCVKFKTDFVTLFGSTTTLPTERFFLSWSHMVLLIAVVKEDVIAFKITHFDSCDSRNVSPEDI